MDVSGRLCLVGLVTGPPPGPGDVVSGATAWWGLRAYSGAIATAGTQPLVNLRNGSTAEQCDVLPAKNGGLGLTANCTGASNGQIATDFCNAVTCFVTKLYDQTGNGRDAIQATAANQPTFIPDHIGSQPCIRYTLANSTILKATIPALSQPTSYSFVFDIVSASGSGGTLSIMSGFAASGQQQIYYNAAAQIVAYAGSFLTANNAGLLNAEYAAAVLMNNTSSSVDVNSFSVGGTTGAGATTTAMGLGGRPNLAAVYSDMNMCESGVWASDISTNFNALISNQRSYWGF
jgi:hypothetical protein